MASLERTQCCGIRELDGVEDSNSTEQLLGDAADEWFNNGDDGAFIFFSTTHGRKGFNLAAYIAKHKLGITKKTHAMRNPNSGHMLTMWVWEVNKQNFERWYEKHKKDDDEEDEYWI